MVLLVGGRGGRGAGRGLIGVADSWLTTVISEGIVFTLRKQVFENLLDQSVGWFTRSRSGELMSRFTWELTLLVLVLVPLISLPARKAGRASYRARTRTPVTLAEVTAYLQEILGISGISWSGRSSAGGPSGSDSRG